MIDPAYKLEKMKEAHEKLYAFKAAYHIVDEQMQALTDASNAAQEQSQSSFGMQSQSQKSSRGAEESQRVEMSRVFSSRAKATSC